MDKGLKNCNKVIRKLLLETMGLSQSWVRHPIKMLEIKLWARKICEEWKNRLTERKVKD
jgi:hypothetical protein